MTSPADLFTSWLLQLEERHLADLTFQEVSRSLRALSSAYVERRGRLAEGAALSGAGKRAAFALFYGPIHFLLVREIVRALPGATDRSGVLVDLGCGTGASGAGWAAACPQAPQVVGVDRNQWVLGEAALTYRAFGLSARTRRGEIAIEALPKPPVSILAAFAFNEMAREKREPLLEKLLDRARQGDRLLIVEPLAGFVAPWWGAWRAAVLAAGGREDEWRFRLERPALVAKLDRAAGLDHRELTARSLWIGRSG